MQTPVSKKISNERRISSQKVYLPAHRCKHIEICPKRWQYQFWPICQNSATFRDTFLSFLVLPNQPIERAALQAQLLHRPSCCDPTCFPFTIHLPKSCRHFRYRSPQMLTFFLRSINALTLPFPDCQSLLFRNAGQYFYQYIGDHIYDPWGNLSWIIKIIFSRSYPCSSGLFVTNAYTRLCWS